MAIGVIVKLSVVPGQAEAFEAAFAKQAATVTANEPGNQLYRLAKSRKAENAYVIMEIYDDEAAFKIHGDSEHFAAGRVVLGPMIDGKAEIELLDLP